MLAVLLVALLLLAGSLVVALRERDPRAEEAERPVLRYPAAARRLANVAPVLVLAAAMLGWWRRPPFLLPSERAALLALTSLLFLDLWLVRIEVLGTAVRVLPDGVEAVSPWRRRPVLLRWSEVASIRWTPVGFVLVGLGSEVVRASRFLSPLGELARAVHAHVALDERTAGRDARARLAAYAGELESARR